MVGEQEVVLDNGPVEGPSAICHLGRDQVGCSASGEVSDWGATPMSAPASHGSPEGGGPTRAPTVSPVMAIQGMSIPAMDTPTQPIRSTPTQDTRKKKGGRGYVVA